MKFLEDWKTTHGTGRKPSLSFFPLWSSTCFLTGLTMTQAACDLTPHICLAKGLSCSSAVNHFGQICTSDWLRAGKVHLSPNTWPHFSTLFCNKVKVHLLGSSPIVTKISLLTWHSYHTIPEIWSIWSWDRRYRPDFMSRITTAPTFWSLQQLHYKRPDQQPGWKRDYKMSNTADIRE